MLPAAFLQMFQNAAQNANNYRGGPTNPYLGGQLANQLGGPDDPYFVGGADLDPYLGGPFANIKANIQARQAGRHAADQARIANRFAERQVAPVPVPGAEPSVDEGQLFECANLGGVWRRTGIILECPLNAAQAAVAAGASLAMSVEPEREVEIMAFELSVEGGATNIEFQETQRASFGITTLAVGQDSMRAASGEGAGTLLSCDKATFRGFVAKSGRQINLTIKNNGINATVNVSALTQLVKYVSAN